MGSCTRVCFLCFVSVWFQTLVSSCLVNSAHMVCFGDVLSDAVMSGEEELPARLLQVVPFPGNASGVSESLLTCRSDSRRC